MARGLVHRPKILFLDEPTTGLDPQTRLRVWDTVTSLQKSTGMTVFMTMHYMEEAAGADKVAIIDKGRIAAQGTPEELRSNYSSDYLKLQTKDDKSLKQALDSKGVRYEVDRELVVIRQSSSMDALALLKAIEQYVMAFEVGTRKYGRRVHGGYWTRDTRGGRPMSSIRSLTGRNLKLFFRDRASVFFSLLSVIIIFALYALFLGDIQVENLKNGSGQVLPGAEWLVNAWIFAGILTISIVTVSLGAYGTMVDRCSWRTD